MTEIRGTCKDHFDGVRQTLARSFDAGKDIGASAAVFIDGEPVVDGLVVEDVLVIVLRSHGRVRASSA
jgi:hypothetical protein